MRGIRAGHRMAAHAKAGPSRAAVGCGRAAESIGNDPVFVVRRRAGERHAFIPVPVVAASTVGLGLEVHRVTDRRRIASRIVKLFDRSRACGPRPGARGVRVDQIIRINAIETVR
jgi:hypothetical protein